MNRVYYLAIFFCVSCSAGPMPITYDIIDLNDNSTIDIEGVISETPIETKAPFNKHHKDGTITYIESGLIMTKVVLSKKLVLLIDEDRNLPNISKMINNKYYIRLENGSPYHYRILKMWTNNETVWEKIK